MRRISRLRTAAAVGFFASASIVAIAAAPQSLKPGVGNPRNGQTLFVKVGCFQCHGTQGQGGAAGPRIAPAPMLPYSALSAYVRNPRGDMPPYSKKVLPDQNLIDIYAYLSNLPQPLQADDIPLLKSPQ